MEPQLKLIFLQELQPSTLLSFILVIFLLYKWHQPRNDPRKILPSPPKLPVLGNIHQLGTRPYRSLQSMSDQYGELMLLHLGSVPTLVVSSARAAREILVAHDVIFANRPTSKKGKKLFYQGKDVAAAPYGEYWRQMKSVCVLHLLNNNRVRSFHRVREEETALFIAKIRRAGSSPVNLSEMFMDFTNDTICRVAFGRKYTNDEDGFNFNKLLKDFMGLLAELNVGDFIPWLAWVDRLRGWDARVDKISKEFDKFLEKIVKEHQDRSKNCGRSEDGANKDEEVKDFVDVLLSMKKDPTTRFPIDNVGIKALILDMFTAGTDTTFSLLQWVMTELLQHPQVMNKLQEEVREPKDNFMVSENDLERMSYLKAVIKETLRLHPSIPLLSPRESTKDTKINGYDVPAKTTVIINGWAIHRDPALWDEPEKFHPERFLNSATDFRGRDLQFIPFGAGRRMCPGISFSMASTELLLATLMHKFNWTLPKGETLDLTECYVTTLHRSTPLLAVAMPFIAGK